jgi:hypothetical protein
VIAHISPITGDHGRVVGYIGTEGDITLAKQNNKILGFQNVELEQGKSAMLNILEDLELEKKKLAVAKAKSEAIIASVGDGLAVADETEN